MSIGKNDAVARDLFGDAYNRIPKSVFAVAAYYLADICSEGGRSAGGARGGAKQFGYALVRALQEDFEPITELARSLRIEFPGGEPQIESAAIAKATQAREVES